MFWVVRKAAGIPLILNARRLAARFLEGTERGDDVQLKLVLDLVRRHASSAFGRDHKFGEIRSVDDFRKHVPIRDYEGHEPYIDRVRQGELSALFGSGTEVLMFAKTSGTTNRPKTIPVTRESLDAYRIGWKTWGIMAFDAHPRMQAKGLRPILQLASDWQESKTPSGIPCGAITGLTASMQNPLVRVCYCMPPFASRIKNIEAKYYVALRMSMHRSLGAAMAANPSTLLGIARLGDREKETIIRDYANGTIDPRWELEPEMRAMLHSRTRWKRKATARRLEAIVERTGHLLPKDYWSDIDFVANWTGGTMGSYLNQYPEHFGQVPVRDPGLIASEGRMTVPIEDDSPSGLLDYPHTFFEFVPEEQEDADQPETLLASQLEVGRRYFILLTTLGGLYRYKIHDLVRCTGFRGQVPLVEFLNKGAHFSSLAGEKLSEFQVVHSVKAAQKALGVRLKSFLLLPNWGEPPSYRLLVEEGDLPNDPQLRSRLASAVEHELSTINEEYENRRATNRLGPLEVRRIPSGSWLDFQRRRLARSGGSLEQYKQPCLLADTSALAQFPDVDEPATPAPPGSVSR